MTMQAITVPVVLIETRKFSEILVELPRQKLIKFFADSKAQAKEWRKLNREQIITNILIENEW